MLPRSAVARITVPRRMLAFTLIALHLGTPVLSAAATAPVPKRLAALLQARGAPDAPASTSTGKRAGVSPTPMPWPEWTPPVLEPLPPVPPGPAAPLAAKPRPRGPEAHFHVNTHRAISNVVIRRPDCLADGYLKNELRLTAGIGTATSEGTPAVRFEQAAEDEDGSINFFRHFYNPITNRGLDDLTPSTWGNSMEWGWDGHDQDWLVARQAFYDAATMPTRNARLTQLSRAFYALGHVVHLVEDLAQPQHTRNDAHGPPQGSAYEDYCSTHYNTPGSISALGNPAPPAFGTMSSPFSRIPPEFAAFWDTGQYTGQAGFAGFASTPGLAEFSNAYFITDDTMFGALRTAILPRTAAPPLTVTLREALENRSTSAHHHFPHPTLRNTDLADFFPAATTSVRLQREGQNLSGAIRYVSHTLGGVTIPALFLINDSSFPFNYDHEIGFDDVTNQAAAQILIPMANAYSTGLVNYFFRAKIGLNDPTTTWDAGALKNSLVVRNESNEAFGPGTWQLYYDDANGVRAPVPGFDASGFGGSLGPGAEFTALFPEMLCDGGYEFTLVFRGKIGNEQDAVAVKTFVTALELWSGTYNVPSGDPLCFGNTGEAIAIFYRPTPPGYDIVGWLQFVGETDLFQVTGQCNGNSLQFGINPQCGSLLSGTVAGATLTNATTCCWYCPLNPPPTGAFWCGTISGMQRQE